MKLIPRVYQRDTVDRLKAAVAQGLKSLCVAPTGAGKSFMLSLVVEEINVQTLWLTHRKELVEQAAEELAGLGINAGIIMSGRPYFAGRQVHVASVDTVRSWIKSRPHDLPNPELIIIDEAHRAVANQFQIPIKHWPDADVVGGTATPYRLDARGLGDIFDVIVESPREDELVEQKVLVEPRAYCPPAASVKGIRITNNGDFNSRKLNAAVNKPQLIGNILETWIQHAVDAAGIARCYLTIGFACSIEHSQSIVQKFREACVIAEHIDADTHPSERRKIITAFKRGDVRVMFNVGLFTEGFNVPATECIVVARPTASLALHRQMIGRATRISEGKRYPIVLDHAGNLLRHGRITRRVEYSLAGGAKKLSTSIGLRTCPSCYRTVDAGRAICPECKQAFPKAERTGPEEVAGELQMYTAEQLDAAMTPEDVAREAEQKRIKREKDQFWFKIVNKAKRLGTNPRWCSQEYKARYGEWRDWTQAFPAEGIKERSRQLFDLAMGDN